MAHFVDLFDYQNDPKTIHIDFTHSHVWDHSAVTAIAKVIQKYKRYNKEVVVIGLNQESKRIVNRIGLDSVSGH
jgi:sulfate permease, SulP family